MWALLSPFIGPIAGAFFSAVLAGVTAWMQSKDEQNQGATTEALRVTTQTVTTETAVAQAEAAAPSTSAAVIAKLLSGTA